MESYLMMLYVTLEQESALKNFFVDNGWAFSKPDLSVTTDKLGPIAAKQTTICEEKDVTETLLQEEQPVPNIKIDMSASKTVTKNLSPKQNGKRKTKSQKQPTKAPKQAKIVPGTSVPEPGEIVEVQEEHNVDNEIENTEETNRPITLEMENVENGQKIQIKIESDGRNICEGETVSDLSDDADDDGDDDFDDIEAAEGYYEEDDAGDTSVKIENVSPGDSFLSQIEMPKAGAAPKFHKRKGQRTIRQYEAATLQDAYKYVLETGSSLRSTSQMFGVPYSTLSDRVHNRISIDVTKNGRGPILSEEEETQFKTNLMDLSEIGYGYSQADITRQASYYAIELGKRTANNPFTHRWYTSFARRSSEHNPVKSFTLPKQKALHKNKECIANYYKKLDGIVKEYNLGEKPENIYHLDEVDIDVPAGEKYESVTFIGAGNAAGQSIPPYFVMVTGLAEENQDLRKSHLITQGFKNYMENHFTKHAKTANDNEYKLVLYDAHRTPLSVELVQWAKSNHILLFAMPPQSSHIVKSSGEGAFQRVKGKFMEEYGEVSPYKHLTSSTGVVSILRDMYDAVVTTDVLKNLFSMCGIYPLHDSKVMCDFLQKQGILS